MQIGKVCKISSVILFLLVLVGSIILCENFGLSFFIYGIVLGFIFCMLLYVMGEIVDKLTEIAENTIPFISTIEEQKQVKNNKEIKSTFKVDGIMDIPKRKKGSD